MIPIQVSKETARQAVEMIHMVMEGLAELRKPDEEGMVVEAIPGDVMESATASLMKALVVLDSHFTGAIDQDRDAATFRGVVEFCYLIRRQTEFTLSNGVVGAIRLTWPRSTAEFPIEIQGGPEVIAAWEGLFNDR